MKRSTLIILLFIISCSMPSKAQHCGSAAIILQYDTAALIADETYITYTKTGAFITTYSDSVFNELCGRFIDKFTKVKYPRTLLSFKWKGRYKMYLSLDNAIMISNWSRLNL